jgi:hypothetical protein
MIKAKAVLIAGVRWRLVRGSAQLLGKDVQIVKVNVAIAV